MKAPPRPSMSAARRVRIFEQHGGICGLSGRKIGLTDQWHIEHRIPWAISFDDSDANLYPALVEPHAEKTVTDQHDIAKCKRMAGETGQRARREKNGPRLKGGNHWPPKGSVKIQSRGFSKRSDRENDR